MRLAVAGLVLAIAIGNAHAADYDPPVLRGSKAFDDGPAYRDWSGFYFGGHAGLASGSADFGDSGSSLIADILRLSLLESEHNVSEWVRPKGHGSAVPIGVFFGYNWQADDAVFGFDITYSHTSLGAGGTDALARNVSTSDSRNFDVFVSATTEADISDILSLRGRGGVAFESFMPYLTLGVAVARLDVIRTASVTTIEYVGGVPQAPISESRDESRRGAFAFGLSAGLGFDWEIIPKLFLRGEYEYTGFVPVGDVRISVHTARVGVGGRF